MPTPDLTAGPSRTPETAQRLLDAIAQIDRDTDPAQIADEHRVSTTTLLSAVEVYHEAGRAAVETATAAETWLQTHVEFTSWDQAHHYAADEIAPELDSLCATGFARRWWFIRKYPRWRIRVQATSPEHRPELAARLDRIWANLTDAGSISAWQPTVYEPETLAFGGTSGMRVAHELFSADSRTVLDHLIRTDPPLGIRETSILLCTRLLHAANLEWFEMGDVWHHVTRLRPMPAEVPSERLKVLAKDIKPLLSIGAGPHTELFADRSPLHPYTRWVRAFADAGATLRTFADVGDLQRGLRSVLAYHVIFHWNRIGLSSQQQTLLAHAAKAATFE
ncbi:thiopeptide-type bacteriocin biosynthesis protein [Glycomyces tenuis]|uniref:thiopeptide-type bacteriocin biosynthesis protein n=1 Tax=Glycomyces tenuis TaxID=58116 RepID=UPI0003FD06A9|nr:thiopeptide-type bacteriocin biosynthesis protein [Glycomyces tenuis]